MNADQIVRSREYYNQWVIDNGHIHPQNVSAYDGFMGAMEVMWGQPQSVGNLQAKIAELEERLSTIGGQHREQIQQLEYRNNQQADAIQRRDQEILRLQNEVENWKHNLDEFSREWKKTVAAQHQAEIDEAIQDALQEEQDRHRDLLERTLADQQTHFDNLKTAVLDAQRQVMLAEFQAQTTQMVQRLEAHYAERYRELEHTHRTNFEQKRLQYLEDARRIAASELESQPVNSVQDQANELAAKMVEDFTNRFLQDHHYRQGVLEDRINLRLDQGLTILKGMVALEIRDRTPHVILDPKLPTDEDFEFWYDQIPEYKEPEGHKIPNDKQIAKAAWDEALGRIKIG